MPFLYSKFCTYGKINMIILNNLIFTNFNPCVIISSCTLKLILLLFFPNFFLLIIGRYLWDACVVDVAICLPSASLFFFGNTSWLWGRIMTTLRKMQWCPILIEAMGCVRNQASASGLLKQMLYATSRSHLEKEWVYLIPFTLLPVSCSYRHVDWNWKAT